MDLAWNAIVLGCLWGACDLMSPRNLPRHIGRLVALGFVALLGFAIAALGFLPSGKPAFFEALPPNKILGPLLLAVGSIGWAQGVMRGALRVREGGMLGLVRARAWPLAGGRGFLLLAGASVASLWLCAVAFLPPGRVDEALYHLALPAQYLRAGGFTAIPGHGNTGFPAMGEMLFMWCMGAGSVPAARAVQIVALDMGAHAWATLLPAARNTLPVALGLFLLTPVVLWELPAAYVDVLQAVFEVTSLLMLVAWAERMSNATLITAGWLAGCAAACKFLALAHVPFFVLTALLILRKSGRTDRTLGVLCASACACLPVLPWLVRNMVVFGNPFYPFASEFFTHAQHMLPAQMRVLDLFMAQHGPLGADGMPLFGAEALVELPATFFTEARFSSPSFDGVMGWTPLWCVALGVATKFKRRAECEVKESRLLAQVLGAYIAFRFVIWLSTSWQMRFLIGPALAVSILCAVWAHTLPRLWRASALFLMFATAAVTLWNQRAFAQRFDARAVVSTSARHALRLDYDPATALCDRALGLDVQRLMLVWTQRRALYCDVPLHSDSYDEGATLAAWLADGAPAALRALQAHKISHLLVDEAAFKEAAPDSAEAYAALRSHALTRVDSVGDVVLWATAPAGN